MRQTRAGVGATKAWAGARIPALSEAKPTTFTVWKQSNPVILIISVLFEQGTQTLTWLQMIP